MLKLSDMLNDIKLAKFFTQNPPHSSTHIHHHLLLVVIEQNTPIYRNQRRTWAKGKQECSGKQTKERSCAQVGRVGFEANTNSAVERKTEAERDRG